MAVGRPLIGVTPLWSEEKRRGWILDEYMDGIRGAGGIPVVLPVVQDEEEMPTLLERLDGLHFTGGHDIEPALYGRKRMPECGTASPERDRLELPLMKLAIERDIPVFAFCRGCQLLNVALGGTLAQDLRTYRPEEPDVHMQAKPYSNIAHHVVFEEGSLLDTALGKGSWPVNSTHHQGIDALGQGLVVTARSATGALVEGISLPGKRFVEGVQWHPEYRPESPVSKVLYNAFIEACRERRK